MPYFANMSGDKDMESITRRGGRDLAWAMAATYRAVGDLEQSEAGPAAENLLTARRAAGASLEAFREAVEKSGRRPLNLSNGTVAEMASIGEVLAWLERRGAALDRVTDRDLLELAADGLYAFGATLERFQVADRRPSFAAVNALVRAAVDLQLLALGITAMFEMAQRSAGTD
jgi:hypothetical protein